MKLGSIRAEVIPVPQTNLFLALINESCDPQHPIQVILRNFAYLAFCHSLHSINESYFGIW